MTKKIIEYCFILIAGIIMLAHDFVPHHHHDEGELVIQLQSDDSKNEKDHHHDFPKHEHLQDDYFFINRQALISSPNLEKLLDNDDHYFGSNGLDFIFIHNSTFLSDNSYTGYKIPLWDKPQYISTALTYTFGLRAPPLS